MCRLKVSNDLADVIEEVLERWAKLRIGAAVLPDGLVDEIIQVSVESLPTLAAELENNQPRIPRLLVRSLDLVDEFSGALADDVPDVWRKLVLAAPDHGLGFVECNDDDAAFLYDLSAEDELLLVPGLLDVLDELVFDKPQELIVYAAKHALLADLLILLLVVDHPVLRHLWLFVNARNHRG